MADGFQWLSTGVFADLPTTVDPYWSKPSPVFHVVFIIKGWWLTIKYGGGIHCWISHPWFLECKAGFLKSLADAYDQHAAISISNKLVDDWYAIEKMYNIFNILISLWLIVTSDHLWPIAILCHIKMVDFWVASLASQADHGLFFSRELPSSTSAPPAESTTPLHRYMLPRPLPISSLMYA